MTIDCPPSRPLSHTLYVLFLPHQNNQHDPRASWTFVVATSRIEDECTQAARRAINQMRTGSSLASASITSTISSTGAVKPVARAEGEGIAREPSEEGGWAQDVWAPFVRWLAPGRWFEGVEPAVVMEAVDQATKDLAAVHRYELSACPLNTPLPSVALACSCRRRCAASCPLLLERAGTSADAPRHSLTDAPRSSKILALVFNTWRFELAVGLFARQEEAQKSSLIISLWRAATTGLLSSSAGSQASAIRILGVDSSDDDDDGDDE